MNASRSLCRKTTFPPILTYATRLLLIQLSTVLTVTRKAAATSFLVRNFCSGRFKGSPFTTETCCTFMHRPECQKRGHSLAWPALSKTRQLLLVHRRARDSWSSTFAGCCPFPTQRALCQQS